MRILALVLLLCGCSASRSNPGAPSGGDGAAALGVVERLFDGMRAADEEMVRSVFLHDTPLLTVMRRDGEAVVESVRLQDFLMSVGVPREEAWDERISNPVVLVDGDLATVWVDYSFYEGDRFSHCGVDSFSLVRRPDGWKVFHLVDTRRTEGC